VAAGAHEVCTTEGTGGTKTACRAEKYGARSWLGEAS
jgi:hypothetical protein